MLSLSNPLEYETMVSGESLSRRVTTMERRGEEESILRAALAASVGVLIYDANNAHTRPASEEARAGGVNGPENKLPRCDKKSFPPTFRFFSAEREEKWSKGKRGAGDKHLFGVTQ